MHIAQSLILSIIIEIQRIHDHLWRRVTGLPQLTRSQISHDLFLGGQYGIHALSTMEKLGITAIVNMRTRSLKHTEFDRKFAILHLPTKDLHAPTIEQLQKGVSFITDEIAKGGKAYVHCRQGEGRGPTMAIAYLMSLGMRFEEAFQQVKKVRTFIRVTPPQRKRLLEFEALLQKK